MKPYYQDSAVTLYHADCVDLCHSLEWDAAITDPPYGCGVSYGDGYDDSRTDYWEWIAMVIATLRRERTPLVLTHRTPALKYLRDWDWCGVWNKPSSFGARIGNSPVLPHWEPILMWDIHGRGVAGEVFPDVFTENPQRARNGNSGMGREKWAKDGNGGHPCPKPLGLYRKLISAFTSRGQTILDPFAGTGTTLRAAKDLGRKAIGIEIEERYCEIAVKRLAQEVLL